MWSETHHAFERWQKADESSSGDSVCSPPPPSTLGYQHNEYPQPTCFLISVHGEIFFRFRHTLSIFLTGESSKWEVEVIFLIFNFACSPSVCPQREYALLGLHLSTFSAIRLSSPPFSRSPPHSHFPIPVPFSHYFSPTVFIIPFHLSMPQKRKERFGLYYLRTHALHLPAIILDGTSSLGKWLVFLAFLAFAHRCDVFNSFPALDVVSWEVPLSWIVLSELHSFHNVKTRSRGSLTDVI